MIGIVDSIIMMLSQLSGQSISDFCELETNSRNRPALVARDGSLMTLVKVDGLNMMVGDEEFRLAASKVTGALNVLFAQKGHTIQFGFNYDPETVFDEIGVALGRSKVTASNLSLDMDSLLSERQRHLAKFCSSEAIYIAVWTHTLVLSQDEMKRINAARKRKNSKSPPPSVPDGQSYTVEYEDIGDRHQSAMESLIGELAIAGVKVKKLNSHEMAFELRRAIDPGFTSHTWKPVLQGDKIPLRMGQKMRSRADLSSIAYPPLSEQLVPRDAELLNGQMVAIGDRIYLPVYIDLMPQDVHRFSSLFAKLINSNLPWKINFQMGSEGMSAISAKSMLAAYTAFASDTNKQIDKAVKALRERAFNGGTLASIRICLTTWVTGTDSENKRDKLKSRASTLVRAVENWGQCQLSEMTGDPLAGTFSAITGLTSKNIGNPSVAPVSELAEMLPLFRPGTPWKEGAVMFRTPDGKVWPYQPGSSQQTTWINLMVAPPGRGKSVLLNMINLALCLAPGNKELPLIHIVDIGPSSSGLISLLKESLPESKRHLAAHHRMKMSKDYAVNPFDTQLGLRKPLPLERSFLVNLMLVLLTPPGEAIPYEGMSGLVNQVVDDCYKIYSDQEQPKPYIPRVNVKVDETLKNIGHPVDSRTTWYEVVDALYDAGFVHEATLAQRYAVPLISDTVTVSRSPQIIDMFGGIIAPTGESLIDTYSRMISEVVKGYPVLSEPTQFDLGEARVVSIDLDEVAKGVGIAAQKQTSVMYMLARNLAKNFYLNSSDVEVMPARYQSYHVNRIKKIQESQKHIAYDEFHRTSGAGEQSAAIQNQVIIDMREGRKWNVMVSLLSQSITDFTDQMTEFATGTFILGAGTHKTVDEIVSMFGLNPSAHHVINNRLNGPTAKGSNVFAVFKTKTGQHSHLLTVTIGPEELWAYSTTKEDASLRDQLYTRIGATSARQVLARRFSSGSAKDEIEDRLMKSSDEESANGDEELSLGVIDDLVDEMEAFHNKLRDEV